jgi:hypothetical protein
MSTLTLLDKLLDQASTTESKEHVLEQMHYAMDQSRLFTRFEELVGEISGTLGSPEFNANTDAGEGKKNPMPAWVMGGKQAKDSTVKVMRLSYWKRDGGISYLLLRQELDHKDRPKYFDLVLGGRKRTKTNTVQMTKLRHTDSSIIGWIRRMLTPKKEEGKGG